MGNAWVSPVDSTMTWGPLLYEMVIEFFPSCSYRRRISNALSCGFKVCLTYKLITYYTCRTFRCYTTFTLCDSWTNCLANCRSLYEYAVQSHVRLSFSRTYQTYLIRATERETVRQFVKQSHSVNTTCDSLTNCRMYTRIRI